MKCTSQVCDVRLFVECCPQVAKNKTKKSCFKIQPCAFHSNERPLPSQTGLMQQSEKWVWNFFFPPPTRILMYYMTQWWSPSKIWSVTHTDKQQTGSVATGLYVMAVGGNLVINMSELPCCVPCEVSFPEALAVRFTPGELCPWKTLMWISSPVLRPQTLLSIWTNCPTWPNHTYMDEY